MFFKQYNYKPRSNSQSSQTSSGNAIPKEETPARKSTDASSPAVSAAIAGRRRSSVDQKFAGLHSQKRTSEDERKASWTEQKVGQQGILGGMWQNFTKGTN